MKQRRTIKEPAKKVSRKRSKAIQEAVRKIKGEKNDG